MYPITELFESFIKRRDSELIVRADVGTEDYDMSNIVDFAIESKLIGGEEFEVGTVVISRMVIKLRLKAEVPKNARIIPYVAFDATSLTWQQAEFPWKEAHIPWGGGPTEWMPLGEFYIDTRTHEDSIWRFECLDKLIWSEQPYVSSLVYPTSMQAVWNEMCQQLGYTYDSTVQIKPGYMIQTKPAGYTYRQVMGWIAGANSASVRAGKDGSIQFKRFAATNTPDMELGESDYVRVKHNNAPKEYTRFVVQYDDEQELTYEAGTGTEDQTLYMSNPLMTQAMVNDLRATLGGFVYQPMEMDARGYPHIDVGDEIGYEVYEGTTWESTYTAWQDTHIPWNGLVKYRSIILVMSMRYSGGFGMYLDAPSKSDQQSEYVVEGPLTQLVKQVNKDAVKLGRNYYGVKTSREEGLVVETEGGGGKAIFNSDELSFWADGERALWFDIPNRKFIFSGTLEGADGTFSGTLQAGSIIGGTISGAAISAGSITGTSISAGTITGTSIFGGSIIGSYIATGSTYPFIELSNTNDMLGAYGAADKYVQMRANPATLGAPTIAFGFGGVEMMLAQIGDTFSFFGPNIDVTFSGINNLSLGGTVQVDGGRIHLGDTGAPIPSTPEECVTSLTVLISVLRGMGILA